MLWKVHGAWIDGYDFQNKDKKIPLRKIRVCYFRAVYHSKKHVTPHPVIAANLDVNNNMPVNYFQIQPKTIRK